MHIVVIADSIHAEMFRKAKQYLHGDINLDMIEVPLKYPYTAFEKLVHSYVKSTKMIKTLRNADVLISMSTLCALPALLFKKLHIRVPRRIVMDIGMPRIVKPNNIASKILLHLIKPFLNDADAVICFARSQVLYWQKVYGYDNVYFVPFGIDVKGYRPCYSKMLPYIVSGGRSDRDFNTLVKAVKDLSKHVRVYIVYGKDTVTFRNPVLSSRDIMQLHYIKLFYELPHRLYLRLLENAMLVIVPLKRTYYVTGHTAVLEAMAMGKTVIVSRIPSILDYIEDWRTGVFFEPGNSQDLKEKMEYLLDNMPEILARISLNARKAVEQQFNLKVMMKSIIDIAKRIG